MHDGFFFLLFEHGKQQDISLDVTSADSMCGKRIYTCFLKGILAQLDDSRLSHDNCVVHMALPVCRTGKEFTDSGVHSTRTTCTPREPHALWAHHCNYVRFELCNLNNTCTLVIKRMSNFPIVMHVLWVQDLLPLKGWRLSKVLSGVAGMHDKVP